jgi:transposase-like protein
VIDQLGQVVDVLVSRRRDANAVRRFFKQAISETKVTPVEVTTDQAPVYPAVLGELVPAGWHPTDRYANNRVECDHGRLKARLRPMRGLKQDRSARGVGATQQSRPPGSGRARAAHPGCGRAVSVRERVVPQRAADPLHGY